MITWRMRVRRITDPKIRTIDELFAIIDGLRVSELYLIHQPVYFKGKEGSVLVQRFLDNEKIQSLKWLKMECEQGWLKKFSALRIPKIFLRVNINSQDESKRFLKDLETFCEKILQEWERGEREMNFIHLYMYPWVYERKQYDLSYFVTDQLAEKLTKTREGSFKDHNIDKRFQLIDRKIDKKGLLIVSGENGIIFVECDYAFRRNRGLGNTYTKILQLIDPIEDLLEGIWSHELTKWEKRREAKRTKKINNYFDYHQRDLDERIEEDKACLKRHLDEWIDFSEGIPRRELAIDQLWDNLHKKISISDSLFDYDSYPDELNFDNDKYKKALEFAEEYRIFRRLPSIFTY